MDSFPPLICIANRLAPLPSNNTPITEVSRRLARFRTAGFEFPAARVSINGY